MIEISHRQAQRLVREEIDGQLAGEQWAVLQAHLEGCAACREYQARYTRSERGLRRSLRQRWASVRGPGENIHERMNQARIDRARRRKLASWIALAAFLVVSGTLYSGYRRATAPPPTPTPDPTRLAITPTATSPRAAFRGVAAFVSTRDGNEEVYLLNPGAQQDQAELVNLTNDPGNDFYPAWSPDGEWIAFLSDRTGKREVFVVHVAGSRLTQLTDVPEVQWDGPLSWSADGKWIALSGWRQEGGSSAADRRVFLVPVGGAARADGPRSLGLTRGTTGVARFSPTQQLLAYQMREATGQGGEMENLMIYNMATGEYTPVTWNDNYELGMRAGGDGAFEWSPDGRRLIYISDGPYNPATGEPETEAGSQIKTTLSLDAFANLPYSSRANQVLESRPEAGAFQAAAWTPGLEDRTFVYLMSEEQDSCYTLHLRGEASLGTSMRNVPGLCVESQISRESWTSDGRWLVVAGRRMGESEAAVYAVQFPDDLSSGEEPYVERLAGLDYEDLGPGGEDGLPAPRMRPAGRLLGILPVEAIPSPASLAPSIPFADTPGLLVFSIQSGISGQEIAKIRPDGGGFARLASPSPEDEKRENSCPALSPFGDRIAFLSDRASREAGVNEVFVMDASGRNTIQLTRPVFPRSTLGSDAYAQTLPRYDCPVWSPDGTRLAAIIRTTRGSHLAVIPADGSGGVVFLPVTETSYTIPPVWSPDGRQVVMVFQRDGSDAPRIVTVDLQNAGVESPTVRTLIESDGWADVFGLAFSPNGRRIAFITTHLHAGQPTTFQLRWMDPNGENLRVLGELEPSNLNASLGTNALSWLPGDRLFFTIRQRMDDRYKTYLFLVDISDPDNIGIDQLARLEDVLFDSTWSEDGRWLAFTGESGLMVLDIQGALDNRAGPASLSDARTFHVDWQ